MELKKYVDDELADFKIDILDQRWTVYRTKLLSIIKAREMTKLAALPTE